MNTLTKRAVEIRIQSMVENKPLSTYLNNKDLRTELFNIAKNEINDINNECLIVEVIFAFLGIKQKDACSILPYTKQSLHLGYKIGKLTENFKNKVINFFNMLANIFELSY